LEGAEHPKRKSEKLIDIKLYRKRDRTHDLYRKKIFLKADDYLFPRNIPDRISHYWWLKPMATNNSSFDFPKEDWKTFHLKAGAQCIDRPRKKTQVGEPCRLGAFKWRRLSTNPPKTSMFMTPTHPKYNLCFPNFSKCRGYTAYVKRFVSFEGKGERLSHTIGLGWTPGGLNFHSIICGAEKILWACGGVAAFVDATPIAPVEATDLLNLNGSVQWTF